MKETVKTEGPAIRNLPSSKAKGTAGVEGERDGGTDDEVSSYLDLEVSACPLASIVRTSSDAEEGGRFCEGDAVEEEVVGPALVSWDTFPEALC